MHAGGAVRQGDVDAVVDDDAGARAARALDGARHQSAEDPVAEAGLPDLHEVDAGRRRGGDERQERFHVVPVRYAQARPIGDQAQYGRLQVIQHSHAPASRLRGFRRLARGGRPAHLARSQWKPRALATGSYEWRAASAHNDPPVRAAGREQILDTPAARSTTAAPTLRTPTPVTAPRTTWLVRTACRIGSDSTK